MQNWKSHKNRGGGVKFRFHAEISAANEQWGEELEFSYCEMEWDLCLDSFFFFCYFRSMFIANCAGPTVFRRRQLPCGHGTLLSILLERLVSSVRVGLGVGLGIRFTTEECRVLRFQALSVVSKRVPYSLL